MKKIYIIVISFIPLLLVAHDIISKHTTYDKKLAEKYDLKIPEQSKELAPAPTGSKILI